MRFRIKSGQSARRFVFDRTPSPAKPPQPSVPRAADLDNPYGTTAPPAAARTCGKTDKHPLLPLPGSLQSRQGEFRFLFLSFYAGVI